MKVASDFTISVEDYFKNEESGEVRHEFYYGKLFEMPGATILHNDLCLKIFMILMLQLKQKGYKVNVIDLKVKIETEEIYLYPDVIVTKEVTTALKTYVAPQPILLAEVLSDSTRKYDSTDKFILYQKIASLRYYLLIEPEKHVVIFYEKDNTGEWSAKTFTELDEVILLPLFQTDISLGDIYNQ